MTDRDLIEAFGRCAIPHGQWDHRAHLRVAYLYAKREPLGCALERFRTNLKKLNASHGVVDTATRGYHETITVAWMRVIAGLIREQGEYADSQAFLAANPNLLDKRFLQRFYSEGRLLSPEAKAGFIEPDREELQG